MSKHRKAILAAIGVLAVIFIAACTPQIVVEETSDTFTPPPYTYSPSPEPTPTYEEPAYEEPVSYGPDWSSYHKHLKKNGERQAAYTTKAKQIGKKMCSTFDDVGVRKTLNLLYKGADSDNIEMYAVFVTGAVKYVCPEHYDAVQRWAS